MTRTVAVVGIFVLGLLAWAPGRAAAQARRLGRPAPEIGGAPDSTAPLTLSAVRG
jgi:hypothetical protein